MKNLKLMLDLVQFGAKPCGSFYVLGDETPKFSDFDFYILESQVQEFESRFLPDFAKMNFASNYADQFTVGLYVYETPFNKNNMELTVGKSNRIEVTVKIDKYAPGIDLMWSMLARCPEIFKDKLWKKSGIPRAAIKERIEHLVLALN